MKNQIYCKDCLEGMKEMEEDSVDIVVTSPPYNIGTSVRGDMYSDYGDNLNQDDYLNFITKVLNELIRVTKGYIFFNFQILKDNKFAYLEILSKFKKNIKEIIIWHKKQVQPAIQPTCLSSAFEFVIVFAKKELCEKRSFERAFFNNREKGQLNTNVIYGDNVSCVKEFNVNQGTNKAVFPKYFVKWFLKKFTIEGDLILDPFMGSGTVAVACKEMKRNYLGFEISEEYCSIARDKLTQETLF